MKTETTNKQIIERKKTLDKAVKQLKKEFVGLDNIIEELAQHLSPWFLFGEAQWRPSVINMWGMTGTGKTALIKRLMDLLGTSKIFVHLDAGAFNHSSKDDFKIIMMKNLRHLSGKPVVICLDEFQFARTISANGGELDKDQLRLLWELLDSGKMTYTPQPDMWGRGRLEKLISKLSECLVAGVVLKNGKIVEGKEAFSEQFREMGFYRYQDKAKKVSARHLVSSSFIWGLTNLLDDPTMDVTMVREIVLSHDLRSLRDWMIEVYDNLGAAREVDFSKAQIFVLGNLDEAYYMSGNSSPDINADDFYERTLKLNLSDIKEALKQRFRNEQIARLGNTHIIYPALNSSAYRQLINKHLKRLYRFVKMRFGVKVVFDETIHEIVYQEGVFPTQGARPVMTTIANMVESCLSRLMVEIHSESLPVKRMDWRYQDEHFVVTYFDEENERIAERLYPVVLKVQSLRQSRNDDVQAHVAVHEAGHAILAALTLRIVPKLLVTRTVDNQYHGFCQVVYPEEILTRELIRKQVIIGLGGYLAEKLVFGLDRTSSGVSGDIERITELAMTAVKNYAMGEDPIRVRLADGSGEANLSYQDSEGAYLAQALNLVRSCESEAKEILQRNKLLLLKMADYLTTNSRMERQDIARYVREYSVEPWVKTTGFISASDYFRFRETVQEQLAAMEASVTEYERA